MKFFRDVVSHLLKNAFEGHTQFSVADSTAVGDNPIRSISLDAVPLNENTIITLSWEGGEKLFEKSLPEQEAAHQFDLISTDLAEAAALTKQGQYDAAKDLMKKLGQKYAENTGDIVQTNLPKLHNTQAAHKHEELQMPCDKCNGTMCPGCGWTDDDGQTYHNKCKKMASLSEKDPDATLWKQAKVSLKNIFPSGTVQEITFDTAEEASAYQGKSKPGADKNVPLWDQNKQKAPMENNDLAPASLSYEDAEREQEKDHEDLQKHIDEKIKTELESALQEKAASVFGPDQIELIKVLRKNGRNWDEIKKILVKDFGFDKDSTNIFVDEQRQSLDPAGIDVEPVKEDKKEDSPLTPPENLVSPETHDKLLQDHEDKKKDNTPLKEPSFTPQDVMDIPEDEEIQDQSALYSNEIARADNDEIHKIANVRCPECGAESKVVVSDSISGDELRRCTKCKFTFNGSDVVASLKRAAPSDLNPLQEPLKEAPTTPSQDVVPMGKPESHDAPQKGDRVFVGSDLTGEKAGFEGTFVSNYKSQGQDFSIVETDDGDLLDVESHRVTKTSPGPQQADPVAEPIIEKAPEQDIPTTPRQSDFQSSLDDEALIIKAELDRLTYIVKLAESYVIMPMMYGIDDESILQYANGNATYGDKIQSGQMTDEDWNALIRETGRWMTQVGRQKVSQTFSQDAEWKLDPEQIGKLKTMFEALPKASSLKKASEDPLLDDFQKKFPEYNGWTFDYMYPGSYSFYKGDWIVFFTPDWAEQGEVSIQLTDDNGAHQEGGDDVKYQVPLTAEQLFEIVKPWLDKIDGGVLKLSALPAEHICEQCNQPMGYQGFLGPICEKCVRKNQKKVTGSDFEKGISQNKTADVCGFCGKPYTGNPKDRNTCPECEKSNLPKEADADFKMFDPNDTAFQRRVCPKCGGSDLAFAGKEGRKHIYKCQGCGEVVRNFNVASSQDSNTSKKRANQNSVEDYIAYISQTLIPDMKESGNVETAKDFQTIIKLLKSGKQDPAFVDWLLKTLIPDLADSGKMFTVEDLLEGIYWMTGVQHPKPESEHYDADGFAKNYPGVEDEASKKMAAPDPTEAPKTQFKDYKITPKYTPKEQAIPANEELGAVLSTMDVLQQNLATLASAREEIAAKLQAEMKKIDDQGQRAQMEAQLQETIEKAGVLINAVESKVVQWKDKLYTLQTEEVQYVPKLTQKELLAKIYEKFAGAEKYVKDVLNGMLSQAKSVTEKTLVRWPNKKSTIETEASIFDELNRFNEELLAALQLLSAPVE